MSSSHSHHQNVDLRTICAVCQTLDEILRPGFGPLGRKTLVVNCTGHVLITNVGSSILSTLKFDSALAQTIVRSISQCQQYTGDGSKTFVVYLTEFFNHLDGAMDTGSGFSVQQSQQSLLSSTCHGLRAMLLRDLVISEIAERCVRTPLNCGSPAVDVMTNLITTYMSGKYSQTVCVHLAQTLTNLIIEEVAGDYTMLQDSVLNCLDNFPLLCMEVEGKQPSETTVLSGIVIQRNFLYWNKNLLSEKNDVARVKFVVLRFSPEDKEDETSNSTFALSSRLQVGSLVEWKTEQCRSLVQWFKQNRVQVILSDGKIDGILNGLCSSIGISTVQFVESEDIERLEVTFNISAAEGFHDFYDSQFSTLVGLTVYCRPIIVGGRRFVHFGEPSKLPEGKHPPARQLVVYGMSAGICRQVRVDLHNSLRVLRSWLEGTGWLQSTGVENRGVHIPAGGTFELAVCRCLERYLRNCSSPKDSAMNLVLSALIRSMYAVPVRLMKNSYHPRNASVAQVRRISDERGPDAGVNGRTGRSLEPSSGVIEPLAGKLATLDCLLQLAAQLLKIDCQIRVQKLTSRELTED